MMDMLLVIIVLFVLLVSAIIGSLIFSNINDEIQADTTLSNESRDAAANINTGYTNWFDNAFLMALVLLWALLIISSFLLDSHPVFFIVTVFLLIFVFIVGMIVSNTYSEIVSDPEISGFAADYPKAGFIMNNFLLVLIVIGLTAGLAYYAKNRI